MGKIRGVSSGQTNTIRLYQWKDRGGFHHTLSRWCATAIENCMCSALTWCMMLHTSLTLQLCMQVWNCFPQILAILLNDENKWTNKYWFITKQQGLSLAVWDISLIVCSFLQIDYPMQCWQFQHKTALKKKWRHGSFNNPLFVLPFFFYFFFLFCSMKETLCGTERLWEVKFHSFSSYTLRKKGTKAVTGAVTFSKGTLLYLKGAYCYLMVCIST